VREGKDDVTVLRWIRRFVRAVHKREYVPYPYTSSGLQSTVSL